jgi:hypothetical protein
MRTNKCSWCKKKIDLPRGWSGYDEPLCAKCFDKYSFGKDRKMINHKAEDLPEKTKKEVGRKFHQTGRFVQLIRSIKKEKLAGKFKVYSHIAGWLLFIIWMAGYILMERNYGYLNKVMNWESFVFRAIEIIYFLCLVVALIIHQKIFRILQFLQVREEIKKMGYKDI